MLVAPENAEGDREKFLEFLSDLKRATSDGITPSQVAREPFNKIRTELDLHWIGEILRSRPQDRHCLGIPMMMMMSLREAYVCKCKEWTITQGVQILFNESHVPLTSKSNERSAEINEFIRIATIDAYDDRLSYRVCGNSGDIKVAATEFLRWAKAHQLPVNADVERAINSGELGAINPNPRRKSGGRHRDEALWAQGKVWRKAAYDILMKELKDSSKFPVESNLTDIADVLSHNQNYEKIRRGYGKSSIELQLEIKLFNDDGLDLTRFHWIRSNRKKA